jgi:transposase
MSEYVGLDVSMEETSVCVLDAGGSVVWEGKVESDPAAIEKVLRRRAPHAVKVGLETGPTSTWLWHELRRLDVPVVCIDARHAQAALSMKLNKTDRNDAVGLAQLMRMGWYREVQVKQLAAHGDGALLASRALLVRQRCEIENQIRGLLKNFGLRARATTGRAFEQSVQALTRHHGSMVGLASANGGADVQGQGSHAHERRMPAVDDDAGRGTNDRACFLGGDRRSGALSLVVECGRLSRPYAPALRLRRDGPDGAHLALRRCVDAKLSLRSGERHALSVARNQSVEELGRKARQARGLQEGARGARPQDGGHAPPHVGRRNRLRRERGKRMRQGKRRKGL